MKLATERDSRLAEIPVLVLPGLSDSGPDHWQSLWERENPNFRRIQQEDWHYPDPGRWVEAIEHTVRECRQSPVVVAHSLGCIASARWAVQSELGRIRGAMLVAPPDVERKDLSYDVSAFAPMPTRKLPFASILVASSNDPWCCITRAKWISEVWGSEFVEAGPCGHINVAAGFGPWPQGLALLERVTGNTSAFVRRRASSRHGTFR